MYAREQATIRGRCSACEGVAARSRPGNAGDGGNHRSSPAGGDGSNSFARDFCGDRRAECRDGGRARVVFAEIGDPVFRRAVARVGRRARFDKFPALVDGALVCSGDGNRRRRLEALERRLRSAARRAHGLYFPDGFRIASGSRGGPFPYALHMGRRSPWDCSANGALAISSSASLASNCR